MTTTEPPQSQQVVTGQTLKAMREAAGMTGRAMAEQLGCSPSHLLRVEAGQRPLTEALAARFATVLADHVRRAA